MIYLDHAATTPLDPEAARAMADCARSAWTNPGAAYTASGAARRALREARQAVAALINAQPQELLFTGGGTEGNNQALTLASGGHAVISAIEHSSVLAAARRHGVDATLVPPDAEGRIAPEAVARALRPDTRLISVQFANNETGVLQPVCEIGALARRHRVFFHCDAVQAFGHVAVDVRAINADLLSLSAHKFYGPVGVGALYVRQGVPLLPLIDGGGQEFGLRSGTENVPGIAGLAEAARRAPAEASRLSAFVDALRHSVPGLRVLGEGAARLPGVVALLLPGLSSEQAIADLDLMGICVSGGAACAARSRQVSHVYRAMGLSEAQARCVLRVSIGRGVTADDLSIAAQAISQVYAHRVPVTGKTV